MRFDVVLNGRRSDLELPRLVAGNPIPVMIDGKQHEVALISTNADEIVLEIDGRRFDMRYRRLDPAGSSGPILHLSHRNRLYEAAVTSELDRVQPAAATLRPAGPSVLLSQLPGVVRQIFVAVGAEVAPGAPLLTLEAMKMENEIRADVAGRVDEILVEPGQVVAAREALVRIVPQ